MISTVMLANVRTKLDEAVASFWTDAEVYQALSDGQTEAINFLISMGNESELIDLLKEADLTGGSVSSGYYRIAQPADIFRLLGVKFDDAGTGTFYPCRVLKTDKEVNFIEYNDLLKGTTNNPIMYKVNSFFNFSPASAGSEARVNYIKTPSDINAGNNSELLETTHPAICQYAYADLLRKQNRLQEASNEFGVFLQMLGSIK